MTHADVQSHLADYLDGDLPLDARARMDAHLDGCEPCARDLFELRGTIQLLRSLPEPEPPADLARNVIRRLRAGEGRASWFDRLSDWLDVLSPRVALPVTAAATAALVLAVTGQIDLPGLERTTAPEATARREPVRIRVAASPTAARRAAAEQIAARLGDPSASLGASSLLDRPRAFATRGSRSAQLQRAFAAASAAPPPRASAGERADRRRADLDQRLNLLLTNPDRFTQLFADLSLAEQELWIPPLAERAGQRGLAHQVVRVLHSSGDPQALLLAEAFAATVHPRHARPLASVRR